MGELLLSCDCGAVEIRLSGTPRVRATCHCGSCRTVTNAPFLALTAWTPDSFAVSKGKESLGEFKIPSKEMRRYWCRHCGSMLYNTNRYDFRVVPQALLRKANDGELPSDFASDKHLYYGDRIVDVEDDLPKYLDGVDGPLYGS